MKSLSDSAIHDVLHGEIAYCKFLSANDTKKTGGHQSGIYISKAAKNVLFDDRTDFSVPQKRHGLNVIWNGDWISRDAHAQWYHCIRKGSGHLKEELHFTNMGKGFPYFEAEHAGSLFVLIRYDSENFRAYVIDLEADINEFLDCFSINPMHADTIVHKETALPEVRLMDEMDAFIDDLDAAFPEGSVMAAKARELCGLHAKRLMADPDSCLRQWTEMEYSLFRHLEHRRYSGVIQKGFSSVDEFIELANTVLNRRKSRAGKSLECHLAAIFAGNSIQFEEQVRTEGNKRPDFIFPSGAAYHDIRFDIAGLAVLAAKTTCRDRWRQVLNEADRLRDGTKFLCTLQPGISAQQMVEMSAERVQLVVPRALHSSYPSEHRSSIWTLSRFIQHIQAVQARHPYTFTCTN